jgi:hypothetical protein
MRGPLPAFALPRLRALSSHTGRLPVCYLAVVNSNVCDDADCEMGRGACNAIVLKSANLKLLAHFDALV